MTSDVRRIFLPYCIKKLPDGRYVILNRRYKPLGFTTYDYIVYESLPILVKLRGLRPSMAAKLSFKGDRNTEEIFLYNDGCVPTRNKNHMDAYLERLKILAALKVSRPIDSPRVSILE